MFLFLYNNKPKSNGTHIKQVYTPHRHFAGK
jgi:hypothetical protein